MGAARGVMGLARVAALCMMAGLVAGLSAGEARAQSFASAFTYQGRLDRDGVPYSGPAEVRVRVFGSAISSTPWLPSRQSSVDVVDGLFTLSLDFGTAGLLLPNTWYEISVKTPDMSGFEVLPRVAVQSAPRAGAAYRALTLDTVTTSVSPYGTRVAAQLDNSSFVLGNRHSQGFIPTQSGLLTQIVLEGRLSDPVSNATLQIYSGPLAMGLPVHTQRVYVSGRGEIVLNLSPGVPVSAGFPYTWELVAPGENIGLAMSTGDGDPDNGSSDPIRDYFYHAYVGEQGTMLLRANRVGVNQSDPQAALHVSTNEVSAARFASTAPLGTALTLESVTNIGPRQWELRATGPDGANGAGWFTLGNTTTRLAVSPTGQVGIGTVPATPLHVDGGTDAGLGSGGFLTLGQTSGVNLVLDNNEIMARANGAASTLFVNADGGSVSIGSTIPATAKLHVFNGGNLSQGDVGFIQAGPTTGVNLSMDANEVQVLNNGTPASLFLNFRGGQVFIGDTANPIGGNALQINGNALKPGGGLWGALSDARAKKDIQPLHGTLDRMLSMHGYTFEYTDDAIAQGGALRGEQIGLLAQEVQRVFPEWIYEDDKGRLNVSERGITALMVESLRDLRAEKDAADAELREALGAAEERVRLLEAENQAMRDRLERIEAILDAHER